MSLYSAGIKEGRPNTAAKSNMGSVTFPWFYKLVLRALECSTSPSIHSRNISHYPYQQLHNLHGLIVFSTCFCWAGARVPISKPKLDIVLYISSCILFFIKLPWRYCWKHLFSAISRPIAHHDSMVPQWLSPNCSRLNHLQPSTLTAHLHHVNSSPITICQNVKPPCLTAN